MPLFVIEERGCAFSRIPTGNSYRLQCVDRCCHTHKRYTNPPTCDSDVSAADGIARSVVRWFGGLSLPVDIIKLLNIRFSLEHQHQDK